MSNQGFVGRQGGLGRHTPSLITANRRPARRRKRVIARERERERERGRQKLKAHHYLPLAALDPIHPCPWLVQAKLRPFVVTFNSDSTFFSISSIDGVAQKIPCLIPTPMPSLPYPSFFLLVMLFCHGCHAMLCCAVTCTPPLCFAPLDSNGLLINLSSSHPSFPASLCLMFLDFSLFIHLLFRHETASFCRVDIII